MGGTRGLRNLSLFGGDSLAFDGRGLVEGAGVRLNQPAAPRPAGRWHSRCRPRAPDTSGRNQYVEPARKSLQERGALAPRTSPCITAHRRVVVHARGRYSEDTSI